MNNVTAYLVDRKFGSIGKIQLDLSISRIATVLGTKAFSPEIYLINGKPFCIYMDPDSKERRDRACTLVDEEYNILARSNLLIVGAKLTKGGSVPYSTRSLTPEEVEHINNSVELCTYAGEDDRNLATYCVHVSPLPSLSEEDLTTVTNVTYEYVPHRNKQGILKGYVKYKFEWTACNVRCTNCGFSMDKG